MASDSFDPGATKYILRIKESVRNQESGELHILEPTTRKQRLLHGLDRAGIVKHCHHLFLHVYQLVLKCSRGCCCHLRFYTFRWSIFLKLIEIATMHSMHRSIFFPFHKVQTAKLCGVCGIYGMSRMDKNRTGFHIFLTPSVKNTFCQKKISACCALLRIIFSRRTCFRSWWLRDTRRVTR